jgi:hypothetical protein
MDSPTDVIPQERAKRSGGTIRDLDVGCADSRAGALHEAQALSSTALTALVAVGFLARLSPRSE